MSQKSIYEQLIGADFHQLHPKIQVRYSKPPGTPFEAEGIMHQIITGAKWLSPIYKMASRFQFYCLKVARIFHLKFAVFLKFYQMVKQSNVGNANFILTTKRINLNHL